MIYPVNTIFKFLLTPEGWSNKKYYNSKWIIEEIFNNEVLNINHYYCIKFDKIGKNKLTGISANSLTYNTTKLNFDMFLKLLNNGYIEIL